MAPKRQRRTWSKPLTITERIEIKCTPEEKDAIYAAALAAQQPVTRFMVLATIEKINRQKGNSDE